MGKIKVWVVWDKHSESVVSVHKAEKGAQECVEKKGKDKRWGHDLYEYDEFRLRE